MPTAIVYLRVSTNEQAEMGVSLEHQRVKAKAYAELAGYEIVQVIEDAGVSASIPLCKRPGGSDLCEAIRASKVDAIIALKLDRLFRNTLDALSQVDEWDKAGVGVCLIDFGGQTLDTKTPTGKLFLTLMAGMGQFERDITAERTKQSLAHKKANGSVYGHTPLGYDAVDGKLIANDQEMKTVRQIYKWSGEGVSMNKIAKRLNEGEIPTKKGGSWYAVTVQKVLRNEIYQDLVA